MEPNTARSDRLLDLAAALSDGAPVDWDAAESIAGSDSERQQIRRLRLVRQLADAQIQESFGAAPAALHESLLHPSDGSGGDAANGDEPAPVVWGPLRVIEKIGRGRFGDVYRAWDPRLDREVALKLLRRRDPARDDVGSAVIEEGRLLAKVRHPNVVTVYGAERIDDRVGVWMELVNGRTLEQELAARGPLPVDEVGVIGRDVCHALAAVHRAGLLHRDIKAQNVMRDADGRIVLMDFGTGRELQHDGPAELAGTPLYLAPEVLAGAPATVQSDVYSVGVLLFHLQTGDFPVVGRTLREIREAHARPASRDAVSAATRPLGKLAAPLGRALERLPQARHANATELATEIHEAIQPSARSPWNTNRLVIAGAVIVTVLGGIAATYDWLQHRHSSTSSQAATPGVAGAGESPRRLLSSDSLEMTDVSADGRTGVGLQRSAEETATNLILYDMTSSRSTVIVEGSSRGYSLQPVVSRNGKHVAYRWLLPIGAAGEANNPSELRVISSESGTTPRALAAAEVGRVLLPMDWAPDGQSVLCLIRRGNGAGTRAFWIVWVGVADARLRTIASFDAWQAPADVRLSPDGRFVAYSAAPRPTGTERHIYLLASDGGDPVDLVKIAGTNTAPTWSLDSRHVYFVSDRSMGRGLWDAPVENGHLAAEPSLIRDRFSGRPFRMTSNAVLWYSESSGGEPYVFLAQRQGSGARILQSFPGVRASFSPDGRSVAFLRPAKIEFEVVVRSIAGGDERRYPSEGSVGNAVPKWFPDGGRVLVWVPQRPAREFGRQLFMPPAEGGAFFAIDLKSGELQHQLEKDTNRYARAVQSLLAPDGKTLYSPTRGLGSATRWTGLVSTELSTGRGRLLLKFPGDGLSGNLNPGFAMSADGQRLAVLGWTDFAGRQARLMTFNTDGSGYRELYGPFFADRTTNLLAWTPDGRALLFVVPGAAGGWRIMRIDADVGSPVPDGLDSQALRSAASAPQLQPAGPVSLAVSPDGSQILLSARTVWTHELWTFHPPLAPPATAPGARAPTAAATGDRLVFDGLAEGVSPDGRWLAHGDDSGNLVLRDLRATTDRRVTTDASWDGSYFGFEVSFAPDSARVAYTWLDDKYEKIQLRLANTTSADSSRVLMEGSQWVSIFNWSADGFRIALERARPGQEKGFDVGFMSLRDRVFHPLKTLDWRGSSRLALSPDGAFLAYDAPRPGAFQRDVYIIDATGAHETPIAASARDETVVGWSHDGRSLLVLSGGAGTRNLLAQPIALGQPKGDPLVLKHDVRGEVLGVTETGSLFLAVDPNDIAIVTASVDFHTGRPLSPVASPAAGAWPKTRQPKWSRDGSSFAYLSSAVEGLRQRPSQRILTIQSARGGQPRILPLALAQIWTYDWSPDGRSLLTRARDLHGDWGIFKIDALTGDVTAVIPSAGGGQQNFVPQWSATGSSFFYFRAGGVGTLFEHELNTGADRDVVKQADLRTVDGTPRPKFRDWIISPDQRSIAVVELAERRGAIWLISIAEKTMRPLVRVEPSPVCCAQPVTVNDGIAWTPDSRAVVFNKGISPTERELWVVGIDGRARKLEVGVKNILNEPIAIHPDGHQIAFVTGTVAKPEIRVLENLFAKF